MKESLLEEIRDNLNCEFLSDIKRVDMTTEKFIESVNRISDGKYSLSEWTEAVQYMTGREDYIFENEADARGVLISQSKK